MRYQASKQAYTTAQQVIPGGVNSPVRAFKSVGLDPVFAKKGQGSRLIDMDGNSYIDYICSWGPLILGHAHPDIIAEITRVASDGLSFGLSVEAEAQMAHMLIDAYRCDGEQVIDLVRMVSSGTEATMSALRLARAYTKRDKILKFEGCYHGHADALLVKSGSGALTYGVPTSLGVPASTIKDTLVGVYNDCEALEQLFAEQGDQLAAVILEPVIGNVGVIAATDEFMQTLRRLCDKHGTVLIFDEVITGFRLGYSSATGYFGVAPDMVCFGKIIGGGMPVGAYGGKRAIMEMVSPLGGAYQAGTLSGNPLALHVGMKQLSILRDNPTIYTDLNARGEQLATGLRDGVAKLGLGYTVNQVGSLVCLFFTTGQVGNYDQVLASDVPRFNRYFKHMLDQGILLAPTQFEAMFISHAHTADDIAQTIACATQALTEAHANES